MSYLDYYSYFLHFRRDGLVMYTLPTTDSIGLSVVDDPDGAGDTRLEAETVNDWIRIGFAMSDEPPATFSNGSMPLTTPAP